MESTENTKRCNGCDALKSLDAFNNCSANKDGKEYLCRNCQSTYFKQYRREHPEQSKESARIYRSSHVDHERSRKHRYEMDHKGEKNAYNLRYRQEHRQASLLYSKEYYRTHKDEQQAYRRANKHLGRKYIRKRRALKRLVVEDFTVADEEFVRNFWGNRCGICGKEHLSGARAFPIDHWLPLSKGHALTMKNAVLMCRGCNGGKRDYYPEEIFDISTIERIEKMLMKQAKNGIQPTG